MSPVDGGPRRRDVVSAAGLSQAQADARYLQISGANGMVGLLDISNAAAGQIKFPATPNLSANANTLDDYEEGTWTPTIAPASGTLTGSNVLARYTKIGNTVALVFAATIANVATGSGAVQINGAPFASLSGVGQMSNVAYYSGAGATLVAVGYVRFGSNSTSIFLDKYSAGAITAVTVSNLANNVVLQFTITYFTAS